LPQQESIGRERWLIHGEVLGRAGVKPCSCLLGRR
jgi:hypothetical protein